MKLAENRNSSLCFLTMYLRDQPPHGIAAMPSHHHGPTVASNNELKQSLKLHSSGILS